MWSERKPCRNGPKRLRGLVSPMILAASPMKCPWPAVKRLFASGSISQIAMRNTKTAAKRLRICHFSRGLRVVLLAMNRLWSARQSRINSIMRAKLPLSLARQDGAFLKRMLTITLPLWPCAMRGQSETGCDMRNSTSPRVRIGTNPALWAPGWCLLRKQHSWTMFGLRPM